MLDPKIFKAYDVRGIYPDELDEAGAYAIGRAYVDEFTPRRVAIGRDMRLSSPQIAKAAIDGAADGGAEVLDLGLIGTEMLYCAVGELGLDGGICVTASHNPKEYTGMKIVRRGALPVGGDSGLDRIRARALAGFGPAHRVTQPTRLRHRPRLCRTRPFIHRAGTGATPQGRHRRRQRNGRLDAPGRARASPDRGRALSL